MLTWLSTRTALTQEARLVAASLAVRAIHSDTLKYLLAIPVIHGNPTSEWNKPSAFFLEIIHMLGSYKSCLLMLSIGLVEGTWSVHDTFPALRCVERCDLLQNFESLGIPPLRLAYSPEAGVRLLPL